MLEPDKWIFADTQKSGEVDTVTGVRWDQAVKRTREEWRNWQQNFE